MILLTTAIFSEPQVLERFTRAQLLLLVQQVSAPADGVLELRWLMTNRSLQPILYSSRITAGGYLDTLLFDESGKEIPVVRSSIRKIPDEELDSPSYDVISEGKVIGQEYKVKYVGIKRPHSVRLRYRYDLPMKIPAMYQQWEHKPVPFRGTVLSNVLVLDWKR